jgi:hypothetical protein
LAVIFETEPVPTFEAINDRSAFESALTWPVRFFC